MEGGKGKGKRKPLIMKSTEVSMLQIGPVVLSNHRLLAPLAGYTDAAFRRLCREAGAGLTTTEMVSVRGLKHGGKKTEALLKIAENETPSCVQLFGSDPADFTVALCNPVLAGFDIIDINMGCPMPKVVKNGDGSALLKTPELAAAIVEACAKTGRVITAKVRLGIDDKQNAVSFCRVLESAGAAAVTVHGRTVKQLYAGEADWDAIGAVAAALHIPVIGNGDIRSAAEAERQISDYGVAGVMIGRGAVGNPFIFCDEEQLPERALKESLLKHIAYSLEYFPAAYTVRTLRKHFCYYLKGLVGVKELKARLNGIDDAEALVRAIEDAPF